MADERPGHPNSEKQSPLERYLAKQKQLKSEEPPKPKRVVPQPAKTPDIPSDESSAYGVPTAPAFPRPNGEPAKFGLGSRRASQSITNGDLSTATQSGAAAAAGATTGSGTKTTDAFANSASAESVSTESSPVGTQNYSTRPFAVAGAPAGFFIRLLAYFLDLLIVSAITAPLRQILELIFNLVTFGNADLVSGPVAFISLYGTIFVYFGYFYSQKGASPGKMLFKIQIHDAEAPFAHLGYGKAFFRESIGKMAAAAPLFIGFLVSLFRADRRALHDLLFDTQVTRAQNPTKPTP